jgi:amino acid transporter
MTTHGESETTPSPADVATADEHDHHLHGNLSALDLFFSVLAYNAPMVVVIGVIPVMVATGNGIGTPITFIAAGLILALFSVGFVRMARALPKPGGFYALITAGLGKEVGLGCGLVAVLGYFCVYAGTFPFGGVVLGELVHDTFRGPDVPWYVWGAVFWLCAAVLGYLKVELSAKVLTLFLFAELVIIVIYDLLVAVQGGAAGLSVASFSPTHWFDGSFGLGLLFALGMYGGFEVAVLFREEVRDPVRTIPRATYGVIVVAMTIYALTSWLFVNSLGVDKVVDLATADSTGAMRTSLEAFGGKVLFDAATILVNTSTFAVILAAHNITARYVFNLSADGILPEKLSSVHSRFRSPHVASLVTSAAGLVLLLGVVAFGFDPIATYAAMLGITSFIILAVIFVANLAILVFMRRRGGSEHSLWETVICPILAAVGLGAGLVLAATNFGLLIGGSNQLAAGLMAFIVGLFVVGVVMAVVLRRARPSVYQRIGRQ